MSASSRSEEMARCAIAIVGGGMVGVSLALMMARAFPNKSICIFESGALQDQAVPKLDLDARSTAVSAGSARILKDSGVWDAISKQVCNINRVHVSDQGQWGITDFTRAENKDEPLGYVIENTWLTSQLSAAVSSYSNVTLIAPSRVTDLQVKAGVTEVSYTVNENQHKVETELLIVADGANSPLRSKVGIGYTEFDYKQHGVIANIAVDRAHNGDAFERFTPSGPIALLPLNGEKNQHLYSLVWTCPGEQIENILAQSNEAFIHSLQTQFGYRCGQILEVSQRKSYPLTRIRAQEQVRSGMVIMGNAAHSLHPVAGQGFNLALRDCSQLVRVLKRAVLSDQPMGDLRTLLDYQRSQAMDQSVTQLLSHGFIRFFGSSHPAAKITRTLGLKSLTWVPGLKQSFFEQMMGKGLFNSP